MIKFTSFAILSLEIYTSLVPRNAARVEREGVLLRRRNGWIFLRPRSRHFPPHSHILSDGQTSCELTLWVVIVPTKRSSSQISATTQTIPIHTQLSSLKWIFYSINSKQNVGTPMGAIRHFSDSQGCSPGREIYGRTNWKCILLKIDGFSTRSTNVWWRTTRNCPSSESCPT